MNANILVVDDEPDIRSLVQEILQDEGYEVRVAEDGRAAQQAWQRRRPDLVLLDIWMPDLDGISLLKQWAQEESGLSVPVIMISGHGTVETAVEATRLGAYDFLEKPLSLAKLLLTVKRALEASALSQENIGLLKRAKAPSEPIGRGQAVEQVKSQAQRIAAHDTPVLLIGEAGSGKQIIARYIHSVSPRASGPFVEVGVASILNNAAIELFGYEENQSVRFGLLEQANGGSLYLDEVADMDAATQAKLLSALQSQNFVRVGGNEPVTVDVRIIAATYRDLAEAAKQGLFREDLYYRLNVVPLHIPPLRDHCEDIPDLLEYIVSMLVEQERLPFRRFTVSAQNVLRHYHWPGNIRELSNLVQRLLILGSGPEVHADEVEAALGKQTPKSDIPINFNLPLREVREQFEKLYFQHHLSEQRGSIGKVAKIAGIERTHLYRKLRGLGIDNK